MDETAVQAAISVVGTVDKAAEFPVYGGVYLIWWNVSSGLAKLASQDRRGDVGEGLKTVPVNIPS